MAIIATLAAMLFPLFATARESARTTQCLSNNRQIGIAISVYMQDYDDRLPFMSYYRSPEPRTAFNNYFCQVANACQFRWSDMVTPYVKNINIFSCPSDIANFTWADQKMARSSYALNAYAYRFHGGNLNSNDIGPGPMFMEISRPAERIMLTESSNGLDGVALWCFRGPQLNHEREQNSCTLKRGRLVTLAFDGHAKSFKMRGLLDNVPYTNIKSDCSQNARCIEQNYPEWAPWSK